MVGDTATLAGVALSFTSYPERPGTRNFQVSGLNLKFPGFRFANLKPEIKPDGQIFRFEHADFGSQKRSGRTEGDVYQGVPPPSATIFVRKLKQIGTPPNQSVLWQMASAPHLKFGVNLGGPLLRHPKQ